MKISVALPCYEMHGLGPEMVQHSMNIFKKQTLKDFEVIVADQSKDDKIKNICKAMENDVDIKYIRNDDPKYIGSSGGTMNFAMSHCTGDLIKVLCLDDYLYDEYSLQKTVEKFDYDIKWLITAYYHTYDRKELINYHVPTFNRDIYFVNTLGTHSSLTILNDSPLEYFDENLIWFVDCECYYRLYKRYGFPYLLNEPTMVQLLSKEQISNTRCTPEVIRREHDYIIEKYKGEIA